MTTPTIAQLQSSSLTHVVQQEIERAILAGDFAPGSKLNERELAEALASMSEAVVAYRGMGAVRERLCAELGAIGS